MLVHTRRDFLRMVAAGSASLAGLSATEHCSAETGPRAGRPNILLIMADQYRGDCVGCDGNSVIRTPNLDRLAREGAHLPNAYSTTPTCTPARSALLTGLSPWHHGMLGYGRVADRYPLELQRSLAEAGYYTFAIGKLHYFPQRNYHGFHGALVDESGRAETPGFVSDYREWFKEQAPDLDPDATGVQWNDYRSKAYALPEELHPTRWTGKMAVDYIEKYDRAEPMYLKVSFARPHSPYDPPQRFWDMYSEDAMPKPRVGRWAEKHAKVHDPKNFNAWHGDFGIEQVRRSRRGYYGSVSFIDEQVGRIIRALEKRGMLENTLVLFFADHGDMTGDHHLWRKSYAYEASARVPMIIRWPKSMGIDSPRGRKIEQPVELRDVFPTFMDAAGEEIPESLQGESMLRLVRGKTDGWRRWIDLEHDVCYDKANHWNGLTDGRWKYIYHAFDGSEQLFDLKNDPGETEDLAGEPSSARVLKNWRQLLISHLRERGEQFVKDGELVPRPESMLYSPNFPDRRG